MFVKRQNHVYDFEIMIWNNVSEINRKSNAPQIDPYMQEHVGMKYQ